MTETSDHKARSELLARQLNGRLKAEGLSMHARRDRRPLDAKAEAVERRRLMEMRRRPSYVAVEAQQSFEEEARLIRADVPPVTVEAREPEVPPSYVEMRAAAVTYPPVPDEVHERKHRARAGRRPERKSTRK